MLVSFYVFLLIELEIESAIELEGQIKNNSYQDKYSYTHHKLTWQTKWYSKAQKTVKIYYCKSFTFHLCVTSHSLSVLTAREII